MRPDGVAFVEGLLPPDPKFEKLFRSVTLETGLAAGFLLIAGGLGGAIVGVVVWGLGDFGPLVPSRVFRILIPSGLALMLGAQTVMSSFFLSLLGVARR